MSKAEDICRKAAGLVGGDRAATHGDKVENHANIARFWNAHLRAKYYYWGMPELTALDVAQMMALLKSARQCHGKFNLDDYIDLAGYAGVAGEIAARVEGKCYSEDEIEDDGFITHYCSDIVEDPTAGEFSKPHPVAGDPVEMQTTGPLSPQPKFKAGDKVVTMVGYRQRFCTVIRVERSPRGAHLGYRVLPKGYPPRDWWYRREDQLEAVS